MVWPPDGVAADREVVNRVVCEFALPELRGDWVEKEDEIWLEECARLEVTRPENWLVAAADELKSSIVVAATWTEDAAPMGVGSISNTISIVSQKNWARVAPPSGIVAAAQ